MKLDKKQLPQLIILGVLLFACIGYVSFQLAGTGSPSPSVKTSATSVATETKAADGKDASQAEVKNTAESVYPDLSMAVPRRDPFQPVVLPLAPEVTVPGSAQPRSQHRSSLVSKRPFSGNVPPLGVGPFNPFSPGNGSAVGASPVVEEKDPDFALTGVVRGSENVAIIRSGKDGRYVVKQGQMIEGSYRVIRVSDDSVILAIRNRRIKVKLGGAKNAS